MTGAKRGNRLDKPWDSQLWTMPLHCKLQGTLSLHWPSPHTRHIIFSIWGEQYHWLLRFLWFLQSRGHANLLDKAMKMPISTACRLVVQQGKEQQSTDFLGTTCPTWTLECQTSDSAGSYMSLLGLINAPWGHTTDGRGQWETGSQTGQHFRHLSQLGSVGRAFCWPLSPLSLACSAASRQENLRQQSSGVRAVPLLQYIDQSSLKESGLDIWDTYWLLHWLSSCPDPHSLSTVWITCTSVLGPVSLDLKGLHSQSFS